MAVLNCVFIGRSCCLDQAGLGTTALLTFIGNWNEFLMPLIYINTNSKFPLP